MATPRSRDSESDSDFSLSSWPMVTAEEVHHQPAKEETASTALLSHVSPANPDHSSAIGDATEASRETKDPVTSLRENGQVEVALVVDGTNSTRQALEEMATSLPTIEVELERCYGGASCRFALVHYSNRKVQVAQRSFVTAGAVASMMSAVEPVRPTSNSDDVFAALAAAANDLPWSAPQRAIVWMGDRPQGPFYGSTAFAQVLAQKCIHCVCLELKPARTRKMIDEMKTALIAASASLASYSVSEVSSSLRLVLSLALVATARPLFVKRIPAPFPHGHDNFSVSLNTVAVAMDVPPGVHPLSNLMTRFPPSHEERVLVRLEAQPFADGELCDAYRVTVEHPTFFATWRGTDKKVAKVARYAIPGWAQQRVHIRCVTTFLMREFSARLSQRDKQGTHRRMESVPAQLAEYSGHVFVVKPYVAGEFLKFNNNNGTTFGAAAHPVPQAFSHFTHHYTGGRLIVVNLQGVIGEKCYMCTGAVIHTASQDKILPDSTNLGPAGMMAFYSTHQCNDVCRLLDLPDVLRDDDALEEFVEKLAREKRPIGAWIADHSKV